VKPTYVDLLRAQRNVTAALYSMWSFAEACRFEVAMAMHFEILFALDELHEIEKKLDWSERFAEIDAFTIALGWEKR